MLSLQRKVLKDAKVHASMDEEQLKKEAINRALENIRAIGGDIDSSGSMEESKLSITDISEVIYQKPTEEVKDSKVQKTLN